MGDIMSDKKLFVNYFITCVHNLVNFVKRYQFDPEVIEQTIQIELNWKDYFYVVENDSLDFNLNDLMVCTNDLYKNIGRQLINKLNLHELNLDDDMINFRYEYTLIVNAIANYLQY